ncbi:DUF5722 domain-containing protein [Algibacter lectus]|uniref:DUF5722 domain-containing protein n=1 Tax=Algibacter lectus TaxID=221126 RepID=A0A4R8MIE0_9FLAO|nr:DUF5722 domain-containing protein [Algibacter lectus]MWW23209.1 hypothetical protein [Algibacter lectus]TDY64112.1 hypothetical protein DFQ06_1015 [Algibacter lectus]
MEKCLLFFFIFPICLFSQTGATTLNVDTQKYNQIEISVLEGAVYDVKTLGEDPYVFIKPLSHNLIKENNQLSFEYFCPTGLDHIEVYFYPLGEQVKSVMVGDIGSTEGWVLFRMDLSEYVGEWGKAGDFLRLDFGTAPALNIQIRNLELRAMSARELDIQSNKEAKKQQELNFENNLRFYLDKEFPNSISNVLVTNDKVKLVGEISKTKNYYIAEIDVHENGTELEKFEFLEPIKSKNGHFDVEVNRYVKRNGYKQDRLLSKWMIVEKQDNQYKGVSHARYTDSVVPKYRYSFVKPATKKGLGGYSINRAAPYTDLDSLGITSVTVNVMVSKLLSSKSSPQNMPFEYLGETYYVNKKRVLEYDKTFLSTSKRNIEVSAILLVDKASKTIDKEIGSILEHPDCDPSGIFSMPNLTTPEGVQYYAAILDFLASRYMRSDKKYGRIHHWIIHNEVDAGWVWTNAGEKTALVFMDIYHKSMRMSHNIARKYNPNSKVFITLTHYWNWTSNPHFYHSKELLEQLLQYSKAEGDFEWAIAQHPYPESLREPKTWLDKKVSFDFNTKLITFKNLEVLDAWVKQPEVLFKGQKKRLVYLSENGTNSPTYSAQDLKEQAAGMAYAMKKLKFLDGIDGFQYHNWQDNRKEGGLRIGLRRFPDDKEDPSGIKPVWKVYQAFGTEKEAEVYDQYKEIIGIDHWDEIHHKDPIK